MSVTYDVSHDAIFHQVKVKVKQFIAPALRPSTSQTQAGIMQVNRQLDETFDITQEIRTRDGRVKQETLFRIQIKLTKFPDQLSSKTVNEIIDCLRVSLNPATHHEITLPTVQGQKMGVIWYQQASPTPLLLLQQSRQTNPSPFANNMVRVASPAPKKSFSKIS